MSFNVQANWHRTYEFVSQRNNQNSQVYKLKIWGQPIWHSVQYGCLESQQHAFTFTQPTEAMKNGTSCTITARAIGDLLQRTMQIAWRGASENVILLGLDQRRGTAPLCRRVPIHIFHAEIFFRMGRQTKCISGEFINNVLARYAGACLIAL